MTSAAQPLVARRGGWLGDAGRSRVLGDVLLVVVGATDDGLLGSCDRQVRLGD